MDSNRIGTFKEYLKSKKKINEDVNINVEWWDACIVEVLSLLQEECLGNLTMDNLTRFVKGKWEVLGRDYGECADNPLLLHIMELIFQFHWKSMYEDFGYNNVDNSKLHSMGVVVEELSKVIWEKLEEKVYGTTAPDAPTTTLSDVTSVQDPEEDCADENYDELFLKYSNESKKVEKFMEYLHRIETSDEVLSDDKSKQE